MFLLIYLAIFLTQWIFGYGLTFAYWHTKYPGYNGDKYYENMGFAIAHPLLVAWIPVIGAIVILTGNDMGRYGLKFK